MGRSTAWAARAAVAVVAALVGFLLVSQLRGQERFRQRLEAESEGDLARILASLNAETDALRDEIAALELQLFSLRTSSQRDEAATRAAQQQLDALEVLAGTVPAHGPGIVLHIEDPDTSLRYDGFVDVVQELRDAGAEAMAVNGLRIGARTAFGSRERKITVDGQPIGSPYSVIAIGQPDTLEAGLAIPGGAIDTLDAAKGVSIRVEKLADVTVPALARPPSFDAARPIASNP